MGGRTSAHIRNVPVPVVYVDFLSMYPTVNGLMDLWKFVTARQIRAGTECQKEIESFLRGLTPDKLFEPETWKKLPAFAKLIPDGDVLPSRSKYSLVSDYGTRYAARVKTYGDVVTEYESHLRLNVRIRREIRVADKQLACYSDGALRSTK